MKVLSQPSSGALGNLVAYVSPFGQVYRSRVRPRNTWSAGRDFMRGVFGHHSQAYSRGLTQAQRDRWCYSGGQVMSHPRLGQRGFLSGQQHFEGINCVRSRVGLEPVLEPPARAVFGPNPVGELEITNDEAGVRLYVRLKGPVVEDIMVFGQAPCSAGRSKRRNVSYLGLLGPVVDGRSEITGMYKARFGEPRAGTKVFIVTCQQKDGWEAMRFETSEIVPPSPAKDAKQAKGEGVGAAGGVPGAGSATATAGNSQKVHMHKGSTRGAEGGASMVGSQRGEGAEALERDEEGGESGVAGLEGGG